jgi:hypothetical protein
MTASSMGLVSPRVPGHGIMPGEGGYTVVGPRMQGLASAPHNEAWPLLKARPHFNIFPVLSPDEHCKPERDLFDAVS